MSEPPSLKLDKLDFSGPPRPDTTEEAAADISAGKKAALPASVETEPSQQPLRHAIAIALSEPSPVEPRAASPGRQHESSGSSSDADDSSGSNVSDDKVERVINVKTCPLCHRPRLTAKGEMDIVTHLAICASQDWNRVDRIVVGQLCYTKPSSKEVVHEDCL